MSGSEIVVRSCESLAQTLLCGAGQGDCPKDCSDPLVPLIKCWIVFPALLLFWVSLHGTADTFFFFERRKTNPNSSPETLNFERKYMCRVVQVEHGVPRVTRLPEPAGPRADESPRSQRRGWCPSPALVHGKRQGQAGRMLSVCNTELR